MISLSSALEVVTATHSGMVRSHNEDSIAADQEVGLAVLADGMGGYNAGEVASGIAVELIKTEMAKALAGRKPEELNGQSAERLIAEHAMRANAAIYHAAQSQPQYSGMGTTLVVALWHNNQVSVGHVGDSRLYRLRGGVLEQITRDHSLLQEQIDSGMITKEQARYSQNKNLVTRALGVDPVVEPEIRDYDTMPGDIYLLCSDGLNDMVEDEEIALTLQALSANLELAATQLIQAANDSGGRDNVSVILVRILREYPAARGWWARLRQWFK